MAQFAYGPVELYLVGLDGDRPSPAVIAALTDLLDGDVVRLLDFVVVAKSLDGAVTVTEIEDETDQYGFGGIELAAVGIAGDQDIEDLASLIPPGSAAALVALELSWARRLADAVNASGATVLGVERIPAPVVNALVDVLSDDA